MKYNGVLAVLVGAVTIAASGTAMSLSGVTYASFSDTVASTPDTLGAATVVLGHGGKGPDLKYDGLRPGKPQEVELRVDYDGSVPADLSLSIGPKGDSLLCSRSGDQRWVARPGRAITVRVGQAPAVSYCSLFAGTRLPLATSVAPDSRVTARIVVTLAGDFVPPQGGLKESGVATVRADGGFTDSAVGTIDLRVEKSGQGSSAAVRATPPVVAAAGEADALVLDEADPASAARSISSDQPIALPGRCAEAGMSASDFAEVVVLDPSSRSWDAAAERGAGAGPFLVLGTGGNDTVVGSDRSDCVVGGNGDDTLSGGAGADVIVGNDGADTLIGDDGDDRLDGGEGHDTLRGGRGADRLAGGPGGATCDVAADDRAAECDPAPAVIDSVAAAPPAQPLPITPASPSPAPPPPVSQDDPVVPREPAHTDQTEPRPSATPGSPPAPAPLPPAEEAAAPAADEPAPPAGAAPPVDAPIADANDTPPTPAEPDPPATD